MVTRQYGYGKRTRNEDYMDERVEVVIHIVNSLRVLKIILLGGDQKKVPTGPERRVPTQQDYFSTHLIKAYKNSLSLPVGKGKTTHKALIK